MGADEFAFTCGAGLIILLGDSSDELIQVECFR